MYDLITLAACVGLYNIIRYSTLLKLPRDYIKSLHHKLDELFECSMCLGFWSGILLTMCVYSDVKTWIIFGFASSSCCTIFEYIITYIDELITKLRKH